MGDKEGKWESKTGGKKSPRESDGTDDSCEGSGPWGACGSQCGQHLGEFLPRGGGAEYLYPNFWLARAPPLKGHGIISLPLLALNEK